MALIFPQEMQVNECLIDWYPNNTFFSIELWPKYQYKGLLANRIKCFIFRFISGSSERVISGRQKKLKFHTNKLYEKLTMSIQPILHPFECQLGNLCLEN